MDGRSYDRYYSQAKDLFRLRRSVVDEILTHLEPKGKLLDLGIGQGTFTIPFGRKGFEIIGVDLSRVGLEQFMARAKRHKIKAKAVREDIASYEIKDEFDFIISQFSLHFLGNENRIREVINRMKNGTKKGGYNHVSIPTRKKIAIDFDYLFEGKEELASYYKDWEIILNKDFRTKYSNGKFGSGARILARKPF